MYSKYGKLIAIGLSVALLSVIVACGGDDEPAVAPAAPAQPAAAPTAVPAAAAAAAQPAAPAAQAATVAPAPTAMMAATAAPASAPVVAIGGQHGRLIMAAANINPPSYVPFLGSTSDNYGMKDPLIYMQSAPIPLRGDFLSSGSMITGWTIAPDSRSIIFTLRKGVQFHKGWGEVTAEDVVWSFNNALQVGNLNSRSGFLGEYHGSWEVIDSHTAKMNVRENATLNPRWLIEMSNTWRNTLTVSSKKVYDDLGEEEANVTLVSTGPFEATEWLTDDRILARALPEHYRAVANVEFLEVLAIPEMATRVAAFKNGEIDIAQISNQFLLDTVGSVGGRAVRLGLGQQLNYFFGGNFWEETDPDGNVIFPREGLKADSDHPWIGDPRDEESMRTSRLVRQAMTIAIDRETLSEVLQEGLSPPAYTHFTGFAPSDPQWKDEWFIEFDPDKAKELLVEAGYANGFHVPIWTASSHSLIDAEIGDAVAQMWENIGLTTAMERTSYAARRPTMIERTMDIPMMHHRGVGDHSEAKGRLMSAGLGGANRGTELPVAILEKTYWANLVEPDAQKRIENNVLLEDYLREQWLTAPLVVKVGHAAVSARVLEWTPYMETFGFPNAFETVVLGK